LKNKSLTRKEFIKISSLTTAAGILLPNLLISQDCEITTDDILGPYYDNNAPYRSILSSPDEPGTPITISGRIFGNDCETPLPNTLVEVWHANENGCYSIFQICENGNSNNDEYHLRGKMLTNENGYYQFQSIQPGNYHSRPKHFHIKFTTQDGHTLVTQIYFEGDPFIENDPWASLAGNRVIPITESENGLIGEFNVQLNSEVSNLLLGDVNFDGQLNINDVMIIVNIILGQTSPTDHQLYVADLNQDGIVNIIDTISLINIILNNSMKNFSNPEVAKFKVTKDEIILLTKEPIAGIQLEILGEFEKELLTLPIGWESFFHNGRLVILNIKGPHLDNPKTIFKFSGEIKISSIIVSGWNEKIIQTEINSQISYLSVGMAYPNPFNPALNIDYTTKIDGNINISVFNIRGKFIETILNEFLKSGFYKLNWEPKNIPSGVYLIKFESLNDVHYRQVIYLK
tara:strand:+ start:5510 stop:6886 length:1377 start_codon:yes stop_codon:yes gene_type:complete